MVDAIMHVLDLASMFNAQDDQMLIGSIPYTGKI